jgi:hypothetical protein
MKVLLLIGLMAIGSTGLMADKCEITLPNTDTSTTP